MATFERSIDVDVPVAEAYMLFSDFESFPSFMEGVESVEQVSDDQLRWRANIAGREEEWTARITEQMPSTKIAWESTSGARNAGLVTFDKLDEGSTRVNLHIEYEPEGFVENVGTLLGIVNGRMAGDLERFKQLVEEGGAARSGWRAADGSRREATAAEVDELEPEEIDELTADERLRVGDGMAAETSELRGVDYHRSGEGEVEGFFAGGVEGPVAGAGHRPVPGEIDADVEERLGIDDMPLHGRGRVTDAVDELEAEVRRHGSREDASVDRVTAEDMMDGGQRRNARLDRHEPELGERSVEGEGPDIEGSEDRLHSGENLSEAERRRNRARRGGDLPPEERPRRR